MDSLDIYPGVSPKLQESSYQRRLCHLSKTAWCFDELYRQHMIALGCRRNACAVCGPINRSLLIRRIVKAAPTKFITLTCRHAEGPEFQLAKMRKALPRLINKIRQMQKIEYLRMLEWCTDGYPHFHLLARCGYIPQQTLSNIRENLTGARIVDIRKAHGRSTRYITKYITKATNKSREWSRQAISVSQGFWTQPKPKNLREYLNWQTERRPIYESAEAMALENRIVRQKFGDYTFEAREAGDEIPEELLPPSGEATWLNH
jgi:hypothetical protein